MPAKDPSTLTPDELEAQVTRLSAEVAELTRLLTTMAGTTAAEGLGARAGDAAQRLAHEAQDELQQAARTLSRLIEEKPMQATLIALVAGLVLGLLTRR